MVWIYGGGFTGGSKTGSGNPAGLIAQSQDDGSEGVIYVAMNYRLGLFVREIHSVDRSMLISVRAGCLGRRSKKAALRMLGCTIKDLHLNG